MSCTGHIILSENTGPNLVVTHHGDYEDIVGFQRVSVDTSFPYPGIHALEAADFDELACSEGECFGTITRTMDVVERGYDITVRNDGNESAYGLWASLRIRSEEDAGGHSHSTIVNYRTEDLYMADILEPGWQVRVSYALWDNEDVLDFMGIEWDEYENLAKKSAKADTLKDANKNRIKIKLEKIPQGNL
jgi:hypothetical protein